MKRLLIILCSLFFVGLAQKGEELDFVVFVRNLSDKYCDSMGVEQYLDSNSLQLLKQSKTNQKVLSDLYFYHQLFTCDLPQDGNKAGALQIPYFWNWVKPNPRYQIMMKESCLRLNEIAPTKQFSNYKKYAEIDRIPRLYLADLLTDKPKYHLEGVGDFYTFGWCSEREMSFVALMKALGYQAKVIVQGGHSWTEVYLYLQNNQGEKMPFILKIDNTYHQFEILNQERIVSLNDWIVNVSGNAKWYQSKANEGVNDVLNMKVNQLVQKRFEEYVNIYLRDRK